MKKKINPSIYSCHALKPFDQKRFSQICRKYNHIISIEDHSEIGGLGSILKELAYENNYKGNLLTFSLKDQFKNDYGSQKSLLKKHGISNDTILKNSLKMSKTSPKKKLYC